MVKRGVIYILLNYLIQCLNMVLSLVLMRYLSSSSLGDLSLARTWQQFVDYSHLGARFSLDRYIPTAIEKEKKELLSAVLIGTIFGGGLVLVLSYLFNNDNQAVLILSISGVFIAIANVIKTYLRAINDLTQMLFVVALTQLSPIVIPLTIYIITKSFTWYLYCTLISYLLTVSYVLFIHQQIFSFKKFHSLIFIYRKIALPSFYLFINSLLVFLYLVMDRFFIDYSSGRATLGDYSVITFAFSALMIIPATVAELLYVNVIKKSSLNSEVLFLKEAVLIFLVTLIGIIIANPIMSYFIIKFTKYASLLDNMHYATLAVLPFSLTAIYYHVLNGLDLRKQMIIVNAGVCFVLFLLYLLPIMINDTYPLRYYIYVKMITGWLVLLGYSFFIFKYKKSIS